MPARNTHLIEETFDRLERAVESAPRKPLAFVGLDGFIDEIVEVVDQRTDPLTYVPVRTIADYAARLAQAAGKSTNVEFVLQRIKMGGNAPLLADALGRLGLRVQTAGALGSPVLNPVFEPLTAYGRIISLAEPAVTIAAEFDDGKIMHGKMATLNEITYANLVWSFGGVEALREALRECDLLALVNWTMIPHMTELWRGLLGDIEKLGTESPRFCFFDLCDPQKRPRPAIREAIEVIASFDRTGATPVLGLNEKESAEVCAAMGIEAGDATREGLLDRARRLVEKTGIPEIMIHPHAFAVAAGGEGDGVVDGPVCREPRLTTGAGDSFNGGYCLARLHGLAPRHAIVAGKAVSGFYVREGRAPSIDELLRFFPRWIEGTLDPWRGP